jgi:predicted nucleotidyltransferase
MTPIVKIPFGSHLYGTNTLSSDFDYKVIYLPSLEDMVLGKKAEIYKEKPGKPSEVMQPGEVETEYAPLQRLAQDFFSGQSWAIECVFAILSDRHEMITNFYTTELKWFCKDLVESFLTRDLKAMVSYAIHQSQMYGVKAERLNAIERLIKVLNLVERPQFTRLSDIKVILDTLIDDETISYSVIKGTNHTYQEQPALKVNNREYPMASMVFYLNQEMHKVKQRYGERVKKAQGEEVDWKALSHAVRVVRQAVSLLKYGELTFPLVYAEMLVDIKEHRMTFEEATGIFTELNTRMEELQKTTTLPEKTPELKKEFEEWLADQLINYWYT